MNEMPDSEQLLKTADISPVIPPVLIKMESIRLASLEVRQVFLGNSGVFLYLQTFLWSNSSLAGPTPGLQRVALGGFTDVENVKMLKRNM